MQKLFSVTCLLFLMAVRSLLGTFIGNPSQPYIQKTGLIKETPSNWSFRLSYFGDYVYKQTFKEEFLLDGEVESASHVQFWTQAAMITFNMANRVDVYGIVGGQRMQMGHSEFIAQTPQELAWGAGVKVNFLNFHKFRFGCDFKYFTSDLRPQYFNVNNYAYNLTENFHFNYHEIQAAVGLSYFTKYASPYINASYLHAKIDPTPNKTLIRNPNRNKLNDVSLKSVICQDHFGLAIGTTIIDLRKATINIEWRTLNQNAINVTGEFRF